MQLLPNIALKLLLVWWLALFQKALMMMSMHNHHA